MELILEVAIGVFLGLAMYYNWKRIEKLIGVIFVGGIFIGIPLLILAGICIALITYWDQVKQWGFVAICLIGVFSVTGLLIEFLQSKEVTTKLKPFEIVGDTITSFFYGLALSILGASLIAFLCSPFNLSNDTISIVCICSTLILWPICSILIWKAKTRKQSSVDLQNDVKKVS